ncbi:hypothetical protein OG444_37840 [Streptomyces sp. NBC_01232]|uniref:hypothetical protein n=1 Tax=Streptomyces sp. NBC_01232 TaxID=2903786 RepID=UPI002E1033C0|nr:hypothetical protein OG444_37840 [Streptomyces sp. NBC_01232]
MTKTARSLTGRLLVTGLLCAVVAACGTTRAGQAAPPAGIPTLAPADCDLDPPTDEGSGGNAGPPTDEQTGAYAGPPTDEETGAYAGPPTDGETGAYAGPPTDGETGAYVGPPTDGEIGNGGGPCGPADWFDMTRDFSAYYLKHRETSEEGYTYPEAVKETRVRKVHTVGEARITFTTREVGKGRAEAARRIAARFAAWRHEVYGDTGTVTLLVPDDGVVVTESW